MFGSVTTTMVWNQLKDKGHDVDRKRISFPSEIREIGSYKVLIDLHKEIKAELDLEVVAKEREIKAGKK